MSDTYTSSPAKTMDDIDKVRDFIKARVTPLRDSVPHNSDEGRAHQAFLDMATVMKGIAQAEIDRGADPSTQHFCLVMAALLWHDHPDFLPEWQQS